MSPRFPDTHTPANTLNGSLAPLTAQEIADIEAAGAKGPSSLLSMRVLSRRIIPLAALTLLGFGVRWLTLPIG